MASERHAAGGGHAFSFRHGVLRDAAYAQMPDDDRARLHAVAAMWLERRGVRESALEAARARLRAIVMTSLAFGLGCVPLAIASGPGANSLRAIGTGVIGGVLASTLIAIFFAPLFFWMLESMSQRSARSRQTQRQAPGGSAASAAHARREGD